MAVSLGCVWGNVCKYERFKEKKMNAIAKTPLPRALVMLLRVAIPFSVCDALAYLLLENGNERTRTGGEFPAVTNDGVAINLPDYGNLVSTEIVEGEKSVTKVNGPV